MLENLHVKNLALIDEIEVNFRPGLNILTGETGAGKSILLGSVNLALGGRFHADMLRTGAKFGLVELTFTIETPELEEQLAAMDLFPEEGRIVLSRKLMPGRSVSKINGETVNMATLKDVASMLIDIHGQHEHQSLLHKKNHLAFLDLYAREQVETLKKETAKAFRTYHACRKKLDESGMDERERQKEISLAEFEVNEIEEAGLSEGEDEEVEALYRRMSAGKKVTERIAEAYHYTSEDESGNASELLSRAIHALSDVESVDEEGAGLYSQLIEIDSLLNDFNRELSEYAKSLEFSEEEFYETENRLNELNHLKTKYGLDGQHDPGKLSPGRHISHGPQGLPRIGGDIKFRFIHAVRGIVLQLCKPHFKTDIQEIHVRKPVLDLLHKGSRRFFPCLSKGEGMLLIVLPGFFQVLLQFLHILLIIFQFL